MHSSRPSAPALFLDRDGTLNAHVFYADSGEWESPRVPADLLLLPGVVLALQRARDAGYRFFLVTNQPSYAKGKATRAGLEAVHASLVSQLGQAGIYFQGCYACYHHPQGVVAGVSGACDCRKPSPFFLQEAARVHGVALEGAWMVGDVDTDVQCGRAAGCQTALLAYPRSAGKRGQAQPDWSGTDLLDFINRALRLAPPV